MLRWILGLDVGLALAIILATSGALATPGQVAEMDDSAAIGGSSSAPAPTSSRELALSGGSSMPDWPSQGTHPANPGALASGDAGPGLRGISNAEAEPSTSGAFPEALASDDSTSKPIIIETPEPGGALLLGLGLSGLVMAGGPGRSRFANSK